MSEQLTIDGKKIDTTALTIFHPTQPGIQIELEYITKDRAIQLLGTNHDGNRNMSVPTVARYAADMGEGEWLFAGDPVRVDSQGTLIDGQHRLSAIVETDMPQWIIVVSGVDKAVMMAIDSGRRRQFAQQLAMEHFGRTGSKLANPLNVASTITRMWHWENGNYGEPKVARIPNSQYVGAQPSHAQLFALKNEIEAKHSITFEHAAKVGQSAARQRPGIYGSSYASLWVLLTPLNINLREKFFFELTTNDSNIVISSPMRALHNRLMRRGKNEQWPAWLQLHWLIQVAAAMGNGHELQNLRTPTDPRWNLLSSISDIPAVMFDEADTKDAEGN